jgi:hypothetical protein
VPVEVRCAPGPPNRPTLTERDLRFLRHRPRTPERLVVFRAQRSILILRSSSLDSRLTSFAVEKRLAGMTSKKAVIRDSHFRQLLRAGSCATMASPCMRSS